MTYDPLDRLLSRVPDVAIGGPTESYTYTNTGARASMTDASGTTAYEYDARDRLLTKATPAGTLTYTWDPAGNLATIRSSNTNGTSVNYVWDGANQLQSVTDNRVGGVTTAAYGPTGQPSGYTISTGVPAVPAVTATYAYDVQNRVTSLAWQRGTSPAFASWAYTYNDRGQRLTSTELSGRTATYGYDAVSRLKSESVAEDPRGNSANGTLTYTLDGVGNRLSRTAALGFPAQSFSYNPNGEISGDTYDADGNTTGSDGAVFAYDYQDRLVSKNNGAVTLVYNCDGDRAAKTVGGVTTQYLVDQLNPTGYAQVLEEVVAGAAQVRYTYGTKLVSQTRPETGTSFYGYDAKGNVTFLTDATGMVTDAYDYDAWGSLLGRTGTTPNARLYLGEDFDADVGLINLRARYYDQSRGRFRTLDPEPGKVGQPISENRYLYANGDAVDLRDPSGRFVFLTEASLVGGFRQLQLANKVLSKVIGAFASSKAFRNSAYFDDYVAALIIANAMAELNVGAAQLVSLGAFGVALAAVYASVGGTWTAAP
jgi:RHS repeat-associated protein